MILEGRIENGQLVLDKPVPLADGTAVRIEVVPARSTTPSVPNFLEQLGSVVGAIHDWPEDLSINHDHYLYGTPKKR